MGSITDHGRFVADPLEGGGSMTGDRPHILLVVGGGIAAYKACELVRTIRKGGGMVTCVITEGGREFVTPMALAALSERPVYHSLFDLKDEAEMGHIRLSREADLLVVCPATANMMAKMAAGIADDLATTLILATDKPVMAVPAMNVRMWQHEATQRNVAWLRQAGVTVLDPEEGTMACGEVGPGRLPEPDAIWRHIAAALGIESGLLETPSVAAVPAVFDAAASTHEGDAPFTLDDLAAEALEPEPEEELDEGPARGGLGGLLSSIISRSTGRRSRTADAEPEWAEWNTQPEPGPAEAETEADAAPADAGLTEALDGEGAAPALQPAAGGPLLARKGGARSAPPTDGEALNHTVRTGAGAARPQPLAYSLGEDGALRAELSVPGRDTDVSDPLAGQPDFDADPAHRPLYGKHVLVTAGPTWEPLDPVRFLANRSSGKQGFAVAAMAAAAGARVTLVAGPVSLATPVGVDRIDVESATEMAEVVKAALPADIAFMVAAVADWRPRDVAPTKMKKRGSAPPALMLAENPDILASVAGSRTRPTLLVGFAAETDNVLENAKTKRKRKGADWIVANDVSGDVMGGPANTVHLVTGEGVESFETMAKEEVARELVGRAAAELAERESERAGA